MGSASFQALGSQLLPTITFCGGNKQLGGKINARHAPALQQLSQALKIGAGQDPGTLKFGGSHPGCGRNVGEPEQASQTRLDCPLLLRRSGPYWQQAAAAPSSHRHREAPILQSKDRKQQPASFNPQMYCVQQVDSTSRYIWAGPDSKPKFCKRNGTGRWQVQSTLERHANAMLKTHLASHEQHTESTGKLSTSCLLAGKRWTWRDRAVTSWIRYIWTRSKLEDACPVLGWAGLG